MREAPPGLLAALERGLLVGLLLGTAGALLLAARNNFVPVQAPLSFSLVFWKWLAVCGLAAAVPAALAAWLVARLSGLSWLVRAALGALVALCAGLILAYNLRAVQALALQGGPTRYRWCVPTAFALATLGLLAGLLLPESRRRALRALGALTLVATLAAFYPGDSPKATTRAAARGSVKLTPQRVLVIGVDGASWDLIEPLIRRGELPHLAALRERGVWGRLKSFEPTRSPVIWTTIATGKLPEEHGVQGFTYTRIKGVQQPLPALRPLKRMGFSWLYGRLVARKEIFEAPVTSGVRRVPAFWNIAGAQGSPVAVVNWWATWPAEPVLGQIVSERTYYSTLDGDPDADQERLTYPDALYREIAPLLMRPDQISYEEARGFMELTPEEFEKVRSMPPSSRKDLESGLAYFYSMHETTRRVVLHLMQKGRKQYGVPHDALALFRIVDMSCHAALHRSELVAERSGTPEQLRRYGGAVSEAYRVVDRAVGDLVAALGEGNVVVLSDHGWEALNVGGEVTYSHRKAPDGILIAAGPAFRRAKLEGVSVYDILPLLLRLKGFPVAEDLAGRVPDEVFEPGFLAANPERRIASYGRRQDLAVAESSSAVDDEMLERLRGLGYIQ